MSRPQPQPASAPLCLQEEEAVDAAWLGRELGAEATEQGSTFRVLHAQLAQADPKLKVRAAASRPAG